jgi:hypothetical protein
MKPVIIDSEKENNLNKDYSVDQVLRKVGGLSINKEKNGNRRSHHQQKKFQTDKKPQFRKNFGVQDDNNGNREKKTWNKSESQFNEAHNHNHKYHHRQNRHFSYAQPPSSYARDSSSASNSISSSSNPLTSQIISQNNLNINNDSSPFSFAVKPKDFYLCHQLAETRAHLYYSRSVDPEVVPVMNRMLFEIKDYLYLQQANMNDFYDEKRKFEQEEAMKAKAPEKQAETQESNNQTESAK